MPGVLGAVSRPVSAAALVAYLEELVGIGEEPDGLCGNREKHPAHLHESATLGVFWCTARQQDREPGRSERRRGAV